MNSLLVTTFMHGSDVNISLQLPLENLYVSDLLRVYRKNFKVMLAKMHICGFWLYCEKKITGCTTDQCSLFRG